ncbi:MAG: DUF308 domain-containing protein [Tannerellaceae bacterium]|jgi:uncharacterized membrane protein HdeD (DUF308 family)|nr:DUF308 domain-containing protein [Tannerellaceae bacterium]
MLTVITLHHSLLRSILGIVLGLLFIMWPQESVTYLVITTGIFFILSGVCSFFLWVLKRDKTVKTFSLLLLWGVVVGSILLGLWLIVSPDFFIAVFGRLWGVILIIAGIQQLVSLFMARKWYVVSLGYYVLPALILLAGVMLLIYPFKTVANTFVLLGTVSLFYGVYELISWYKFRPKKVEFPQDEP